MTSLINQYKEDIFNKLNFNFKKGRRILDVGCGDGSDAEIFINQFGLDTHGIDIYRHKNVDKIVGLKFRQAGIFDMPFGDQSFDYVFLHDVLHHIDEEEQSYEKHIRGLREVARVCKDGGHIIIVEANRYNPLFYPHMTLLRGHNHFKQAYFKKVLGDVFDTVEFKFFEAHLYPGKLVNLFKVYEFLLERLPFLRPFLAYNVAIIRNGRYESFVAATKL